MKCDNQCISRGKVLVIHVFAGMVLALFFGLVFGYFVMLLWNALLPDIFSWRSISYWQGAGLVVLFRLLFGSHGYHAGSHRHCTTEDSRQDYYKEWWEKEGKQIFQDYVAKHKRDE